MTSHNTRTSRGLRFGVLAFVVGGLLLLAGCSGGAPADPGAASPTSEESASPSTTPTPTQTRTAVYKPADASGPAQNVPVPVLPEVAKTETKEGLEAFARHWYSTLSYAYETGDMAPLEAVSQPSCGSCGKVKKEVTDWHSGGRWLTGGRVSVEGVDSNFVETQAATYQVVVQVRQERIDYHLSDGSVKGSLDPLPVTPDIIVAAYDGSGWKAQTIEHLAQ
jgi:hypothetical protein